MDYSLSTRVRAVFLDGQWVAGTNYKQILEDVNWEMATLQVADLNTILKLTFHINYYVQGVLNVLKGGELTIRDKFSFDCDHIESANDWEQLKTGFFKNADEFVKQVELMPESKLSSPFVRSEYGDFRANIEVLIEHSYYHLGQISLIRKLISVEGRITGSDSK